MMTALAGFSHPLLFYLQRVFATTHNASEQAHDLSAKLVDQLHVLQVSEPRTPTTFRSI